jgi:hypothetical protein
MTRVLFVGQRPETVGYSDPAIPPGFKQLAAAYDCVVIGYRIRTPPKPLRIG